MSTSQATPPSFVEFYYPTDSGLFSADISERDLSRELDSKVLDGSNSPQAIISSLVRVHLLQNLDASKKTDLDALSNIFKGVSSRARVHLEGAVLAIDLERVWRQLKNLSQKREKGWQELNEKTANVSKKKEEYQAKTAQNADVTKKLEEVNKKLTGDITNKSQKQADIQKRYERISKKIDDCKRLDESAS